MKKTLSTAAFLLVCISILAQNPKRVKIMSGQVQDSTSMAELFYGYDFSDVPTGYLADAGLSPLELSRFEAGAENVPAVTFPILYSIVESMKEMDVSSVRQWPLDCFAAQGQATDTSFPLWVSAYQYNSLAQSAQSYVQLINGHLVKNPSATAEDLYDTHTLFSFAPGRMVVTEGSISMTCIGTPNSGLAGLQMLFNADDGLGYRPIQVGQNLAINYSSPGIKDLSLQFLFAGACYTVHSRLIVKEPVSSPHNMPNQAPDWVEDYVFLGDTVHALIKSKLCQTSGHKHRPLIIVEGFDPIRLLGDDNGATSLKNIYGNLNYADIFSHYDVYYIDWLNSEADIRANARLLVKIINAINNEKHDENSTEDNVIVAQSMGGLITQYALRHMELNNISHEVSHVFYHDVPFHGVMIPPGVTYAIQSLFRYLDSTNLPGIIDDYGSGYYSFYKENVERYLYSTSAQQMLINYIDPDGILDHSEFNALQQTLRYLGLPQGDVGKSIVNIAISNGGASEPLSNQLLANGNHYLNFTASMTPVSLLSVLTAGIWDSVYSCGLDLTGSDFGGDVLSVFPGLSRYTYHLEVNPHSGNNTIVSRLQVVYNKVVFFFIPVQRTVFDDVAYAPSFPGLDLVNGSYYELNQNLESGNPLASLNSWWQLLPQLLEANCEMNIVPKIQFVPTYSSLRDQGGINNPSKNYKTSPLTYLTTAFDGYCLPESAQYHTSLFPWDIIDAQTQIYVDCPDTIHVGDHLHLANYSGDDVCWGYNSNFLRISQRTGRVSDIIAELDLNVTGYGYNQDKSVYVSRSKRVHLIPRDTPPIYLEPHFYGDTLAMEIHSPDPVTDRRMQTDSVQRTWFCKWDLQPLEEYYDNPIKFTIVNFSQQVFHYKLTIAAHVNDPENGFHNQFIDYSFWNNQRIQLLQPTSIVFNQEMAFMTSNLHSGYYPLVPEPFFVSLDPTPAGDYTDNLITPTVVFRNPLGEEYPCTLYNNAWFLPGFFQDGANQYALESIFRTLDDGEMSIFVIEMVNAGGGEPVQSFHIPVLRRDDLNL